MAAARDALYAALRGGRGSGPTIASEAAVKRAAGAGGIASLDKARGLWQAVLVRAGLAAAGPSLEEVLAGGEGSAGQVALLQAQLRRVSSHTDGGHGRGGADASSASSSGSGGSDGDSLQARLWGRIVDSATTAASAAAPDEGASAARAAGSAMDAPQQLLDVASLQERHRAELYASPAAPAPYPGWLFCELAWRNSATGMCAVAFASWHEDALRTEPHRLAPQVRAASCAGSRTSTSTRWRPQPPTPRSGAPP
jgi:hypothetical protein